MLDLVPLKTEIETRLRELKEEYKKGQERLIALEQETADLSNTMLRISGAVQVLEELLGKLSENSGEEKSGIEFGENSEK
jgi:predicted nuclease with TOPRIM domain